MDEPIDVAGLAVLFIFTWYQHQLLKNIFFYVNACQQTQVVLK